MIVDHLIIVEKGNKFVGMVVDHRIEDYEIFTPV
jgi:hypothetical protein